MKRLVLIEDGVETDVRCEDCTHWNGGEWCGVIRPWSGTKPHDGAWLDSDDTAHMGTQPDFGCALFEEKS